MKQEPAGILERVKLVCCVGVSTGEHFRLPFLRHFLNHYRTLGILPSNFLLTLHSHHPGSDLDAAENVLAEFNIRSRSHIHGAYECFAFHESNLRQISDCSPDDWVVYVDFDEYLELPSALPDLILQLEHHNLNTLYGVLIDRIALGGLLPEITAEPSIWEQFPVCAQLTQELVTGCPDKICLFKPHLIPSMGHHFLMNPEASRAARSRLKVHHFKWDASLIPRLRNTLLRFQTDKSRYYWYSEVERVLSMLQEGRIPPQFLPGLAVACGGEGRKALA